MASVDVREIVRQEMSESPTLSGVRVVSAPWEKAVGFARQVLDRAERTPSNQDQFIYRLAIRVLEEGAMGLARDTISASRASAMLPPQVR